MVFVRYPTQYKGYVKYRGHHNGGMTKIESHNVEFFEDEFPTIGEVKKNVELFVLQWDIQPSFVRRRIWILTNSSKVVCLPYPKRMGETCPPWRMRFIVDLLYMKKVNL